ncbi:MAG TPA: hypothetical protein VKL22_07970 [Actinomycetota bacterium]|nr:hypothetical protein [Actinomycetota bacterium]
MSQDLELFRKRVEEAVHHHPVVIDNTYTRWFAKGEATGEEVRHLAVQFSVFSHQFVEAQLRKVINAADLETYRAGKEILMNELGVVYRPPGGRRQAAGGDSDPEVVGTEGSVEASTFRFSAAHFEWLLNFGESLGLKFGDMGKRRHATPSTLFFCDELLRIYGSEDPSVGEGASFAVEHWAAAGFWKELIAGLKAFKERESPLLPLGFWTWHDKIEDQHAAHTSDELGKAFDTPGFDEEKFLQGAQEMLDGVKAFWDGLWSDHVVRHAA